MADLYSKLNDLERRAKQGLALSDFWKKQCEAHGEEKAQQIMNALVDRPFHIVQKSVEWEGLTLSRHPTDIEKIAVKAISQAQESGKEQITKVLLEARTRLIKDAVRELSEMKPANYHTLVLTPPKSVRKQLKGQLEEVYARGRALVAAELDAQRPSKAQEKIVSYIQRADDPPVPESVLTTTHGTGAAWMLKEGETPASVAERVYRLKPGTLEPNSNGHESKQDEIDDELLESLSALTLARLANSIQSRAIEIIASLVTLGMAGRALIDRVKEMIGDLSTKPEELTASGIVNRVLNEGRTDEGEARKEDWQTVTYSCVLDNNSCSSCEEEDGKESTDTADLEPVPNNLCLGGSMCRCFWIYRFSESKQISIRLKHVQNLPEESTVEITVRKNDR